VQGDIQRAIDVLREGIRKLPEESALYDMLDVVCDSAGQSAAAEHYRAASTSIWMSNNSAPFWTNLRQIRKALTARGIRLACMRYPLLRIQLLKAVFEPDLEGLIFVDNDERFREFIREHGQRQLFGDLFGGNFGHCTALGQDMIAENVAAALMREHFFRRGSGLSERGL
jgi:hypothetical protein